MAKLKAPETDEEYEAYHQKEVEFILNKWKEKGTVTDEESSKEYIEEFLYLLSHYAPVCLIRIIIDVGDLTNEFSERYDWKE